MLGHTKIKLCWTQKLSSARLKNYATAKLWVNLNMRKSRYAAAEFAKSHTSAIEFAKSKFAKARFNKHMFVTRN